MAQSQISFRVDSDVKKQAEYACEHIGMSLSTAMNIFITRLGAEQRIPFEVRAPDTYLLTEEELVSRLADLKKGINCSEHDLIGI